MQRKPNIHTPSLFALTVTYITFLHRKRCITHRKLQECLQEHGGGEIAQVWFDGNVPLFHVNLHTQMALKKLLASQSDVEKKLMTKLQRALLYHRDDSTHGTVQGILVHAYAHY